MAVPTPAWTSADSKMSTEYLKALKHDLYLWLAKAGDNEVGARKIVEAIDEKTIEELTGLIDKISEEISNPSTFQIVRC